MIYPAHLREKDKAINHYRTNEFIRHCLTPQNQTLPSRILGGWYRFIIKLRRIYG
jgi:hypothetical protein